MTYKNIMAKLKTVLSSVYLHLREGPYYFMLLWKTVQYFIAYQLARLFKRDLTHQECPEAIPSFAKLEGMRIAPGFTSKVRNIIGGPKGCAHLSGLLMAMASAALQGLWTYQARERQRDNDINEIASDYLVNTCWVWRQDGPLVKSLSREDKIS